MELHERIKSFRIGKSMTQKALADLVGVSINSIGSWESGVKTPSIASIIALSFALDVSVDSLLGVSRNSDSRLFATTKDETKLLRQYRELDYYGKKAVNAVCLAEHERIESARKTERKVIEYQKPARYIPKYLTPSAAGLSVPLDCDQFEMIPVTDDVPSDAEFAVRIQGDSMAPYINDGDTVFAKKTSKMSIGDVGIFCVNGSMYCKQYFVDDAGNLILVSANPHLKKSNVFVNADSCESVECLGKVIMERKIGLPDYLFE